jgi:hypothetical protein
VATTSSSSWNNDVAVHSDPKERLAEVADAHMFAYLYPCREAGPASGGQQVGRGRGRVRHSGS